MVNSVIIISGNGDFNVNVNETINRLVNRQFRSKNTRD